MKWLRQTVLACAFLCVSGQSFAAGVCTGKFPNFITDICWSCIFPIKVFGVDFGFLSPSQEDSTSMPPNPVCFCQNPPVMGFSESFWEPVFMVDVTNVPGCFPLLGGIQLNLSKNNMQYGSSTQSFMVNNGMSSAKANQNVFQHSHFYLNPVLYVMGAILDDDCLDNRGYDIPWISELDPTYNDDALAMVLTPYAYPFSGLLSIIAGPVDAVAATSGFPISSLFWVAGAYGPIFPLTGTIQAKASGEQVARLETTRMLAKQHAAGAAWGTTGSMGMCGGYPQPIMDKQQYKITRLLPFPEKKVLGKCCGPIGRSTILMEVGTGAPISKTKDFGYMFFRKRDCCSGAIQNSIMQ